MLIINHINNSDNDGQMIFGDLVGLNLTDIRLTGEEKPRKNFTQETCPDRGSNPGPLRDRRACYRLAVDSEHHFIPFIGCSEILITNFQGL